MGYIESPPPTPRPRRDIGKYSLQISGQQKSSRPCATFTCSCAMGRSRTVTCCSELRGRAKEPNILQETSTCKQTIDLCLEISDKWGSVLRCIIHSINTWVESFSLTIQLMSDPPELKLHCAPASSSQQAQQRAQPAKRLTLLNNKEMRICSHCCAGKKAN